MVQRNARQRILGTFSELGEIPEIEGPKFVFAHIIPPHPPYFFGPNGENVRSTTIKMDGPVWLQKKNYLNQLTFVNKQLERLVEQVLSKSETPPIIIFQADHGSASTFYGRSSSGWDRPNRQMLGERMSIFSAYYLPDNGTVSDSASPVNTFRHVFNSYFGADYELLPDRSYYSTYQKPYKFTDVTEDVDK